MRKYSRGMSIECGCSYVTIDPHACTCSNVFTHIKFQPSSSISDYYCIVFAWHHKKTKNKHKKRVKNNIVTSTKALYCLSPVSRPEEVIQNKRVKNPPQKPEFCIATSSILQSNQVSCKTCYSCLK